MYTQQAWVVLCSVCGGGMMWGLQAQEVRLIMDQAFAKTGYPETFEMGDLGRLCEIEYCTCDENKEVQ